MEFLYPTKTSISYNDYLTLNRSNKIESSSNINSSSEYIYTGTDAVLHIITPNWVDPTYFYDHQVPLYKEASVYIYKAKRSGIVSGVETSDPDIIRFMDSNLILYEIKKSTSDPSKYAWVDPNVVDNLCKEIRLFPESQ